MLRLITAALIAWRQSIKAEKRFLKELPIRIREPIALLESFGSIKSNSNTPICFSIKQFPMDGLS